MYGQTAKRDNSRDGNINDDTEQRIDQHLHGSVLVFARGLRIPILGCGCGSVPHLIMTTLGRLQNLVV